MITCEHVTKEDIQSHYDWATPFYRLLWGAHIHHGLWEGEESPHQAQVQLIDRLADAAAIAPGSRVLDVGCGMGGSSIHLARQRQCDVTGLTLSRVQQGWASMSARLQGVGRRTRFLRRDAETSRFPPAAFDIVWSIECTEHIFDKARFFRNLAESLRPGGRLAVVAWLAKEEPRTVEEIQQLREVCEGFLCPSLGTASQYCAWMTDAGLEAPVVEDVSDKVARTWEICAERVERSRVKWIAPLAGPNMVRFLRRFETILGAYRSGAMRYAYFVARKPA